MKSLVLLSALFSSLVFAQTEINLPKVKDQNGRTRLIFINATNGTAYCESLNFRDAVGGTIYCGEDEDTYNTYDWYSKEWVSKDTGSKNQCYPLYKTIICK